MSSVVATNSESAVTTLIDLDEDLEDGEIDDDDDDEPQLVGSSKSKTERDKHDDDDVQFVAMDTADKHNPDDDIIFMGMVNSGGGGGAAATPPENSNNSSSSKSKKPRPLEDDHAVSIEIAIANALKKKGIEPPMPKMLNTSCESDATATTSAAASVDGPTSDSSKALQQQQQQSRSSRRRKRKKEREREQKKDKEHKKRPRQDSLEEAPGSEDMDEYEMMNVRGGSPPPGGAAGGVPPSSLPRFPGDWADMAEGGISYETAQDYSSYDSYSDDDTVGPGSNANQPRRQRRDKESRGRKRRDRDRDNDRRHDGKRNRRDSGGNTAIEEKREPRKLELCKFYLMDCCAKRDKCSYMHKEFPCKYYYLGMECHAGDDCLFHHGEPLTEQLRNILLKHMETAPKEILGDFKRISRDQAMVQMTRRHEALCEEYKVENTWNNILANANNRRQEQVNQQQNQQQQQQQQQLMSQPPPQVAQTAATLAPIPSLLDMVINPPPNLADKADKKRKSRWAEKSTANKSSTTAAALASATASAPTTAATGTSATSSAPAAGSTCESSDTKLPAHLDLKNLTNVLSADHMSKLNKLGISNLEEMMQVPFGKLTEVGLTLVEIGEIQRKAAAVADTSADQQAAKQNDNPDTGSNQKKPETDVNNASSSNSNSNSNGFIMVDYTQYLKDAHVNFDRNDPQDDCDDEEQLVIDDGNESEDERKKKSSALQLQDEDDTPLPSVFDLPSFMSNMLKDNKADPPTTIANNSSESIALPTSSTTTLTSATSPSETKANADNSGATIFSKIIFGDKHPDPEARAAFYRDIIRNPFKTHIGDADNDNSNSGGEFYAQHDSRSLTPTPTGSSSTPEPGSQSPKPLEEVLAGKIAATAAEAAAVIAAGGGGATPAKPSLYTRTTMYDFDPVRVEQQAARAAARKADKDLRPQMCVGTDRDIDMRLPFEPMKHYLPATEIDAAIFSHSPIRWQLQEVDVELASYAELRLAAAYKEERDIRDPRIRRVLGLPDHPDGLAHEERERKTSACISSPESVQMSPSGRDAQPTSPPPPSVHLPSMSVPPPIMNIPPPNLLLGTETSATSVRTDPRRDPRRAHLANSNNNYAGAAGGAAASAGSGGGNRQIGEIRNVLQASNWYKNLGSNNKIMVNQQLALVFTELKKFHQLEQPNKIFDVSFIVNNRTLQQIFGQLHIYIDDNGLVVQLLDDGPPTSGSAGPANTPAAVPNMPVMLPNMSQPPPNLANLIRQPPPNLCGPMGPTTLLQMGLPPFNQPPPNARPRLLGMPRNVGNMMMAGLGSGANNPFKPFGGGGGPGPGPGMGPVNIGNLGVPFNGIGVGPMRNFGGGGGMNNQGGGNRHFGGGGGVANRNQRGGGGGNRSRNNI